MSTNNQSISQCTVSLAPQIPRTRKRGHELSGSVYVVQDPSYPLDKKFIVKKINTTKAKKDKSSKIYELEILKNVNHNRIVQLCGFVLEESSLYIFLDYMEQGTLANYIKETNEHGLDIEEVQIFTRQILEGVSYLHSYEPQIIHRDIKGRNILMFDNRNIKLTDFALSKMVTSNSNHTAGVGTCNWMAPEVINSNDSSSYDFKADIWSTGVTVVEMATGGPIFPKLSNVDAIARIGDGTPPQYDLPEDAPDDLKEFLHTVFNKDPKQRPTADELLAHKFVKDEHDILRQKWENCLKKHDDNFKMYLEKKHEDKLNMHLENKHDDSIFLPVDKFNLYYLPEGYQDHDIFTLINNMAYLVVKIKTSFVSEHREEYHNGVEYPGYKSRGTRSEITGSGRVWNVYSHLEEENRPCKCSQCSAPGGAPVTSWGEVNIVTAKHVVFDGSEAGSAVCFLNFNNRHSRPIALAGTGVGWNDLDEDICYLRCVTHDLGLVDRLRDGLDTFNRQCDVVYKKFKDMEPSANFVAIVSHPHGWYKQVSLGTCEEVETDSNGGSTYRYTACTCKGSSGAPVYNISKREARWVTHHHSRTCISGRSWF